MAPCDEEISVFVDEEIAEVAGRFAHTDNMSLSERGIEDHGTQKSLYLGIDEARSGISDYFSVKAISDVFA